MEKWVRCNRTCVILGKALSRHLYAQMGLFAAEQSRGTGEQMTHWDMLNKAIIFEFSLFNMSQWVICSPLWGSGTT